MREEDLNKITNKLIKLADEKSDKDIYNKGYIDGLYQALRICLQIYFGEVMDDTLHLTETKPIHYQAAGTLPEEPDKDTIYKVGGVEWIFLNDEWTKIRGVE